MPDVPTAPPVAGTAPAARRSWLRLTGASGFLDQYVRVVVPFWNSERKWRVRGMAALFVATDVALILIVIGINFWNARLFNALQQRSFQQFFALLGLFAALLVANIATNVVHLRVLRRLQIEWREWLTRRVLGAWMEAGREYQIGYAIGEHDNPDGRIAEDIRITCEDALALTHSLLYNALQLVSFVNILWVLSGALTLRIAGTTVSVPGHMVWIALIYAIVGSTLAIWVGRPLVSATNRRQSREQDFRFGLVRARENAEAIALIRGETDERRRLLSLFGEVMGAWHAQTSGLGRILAFTTANTMLANAFPLMIAAPRYIMQMITLGTLVQTAQAFQLVVSAMSWPVDNLAQLAEWRASAGRVLSLYADLQALGLMQATPAEHRIAVTSGTEPELTFQDVRFGEPDGSIDMQPVSGTIRLGEHVLAAGEPELTDRLPRVIAGLWPWGTGTLLLPANGSIVFMPEAPYVPAGTLRDAIGYPSLPDAADADSIAAALRRIGLGRLEPRLGQVADWSQELSRADCQLLGFARLLLQRPGWIFVQRATSALGEAGKQAIMTMLQAEFAQATIVYVGDESATPFCAHKLLFARAHEHTAPTNTSSSPAVTPIAAAAS